MTNESELFQLVWTMRCKQRDYYKRPIAPRLIAAKAAEKAVDEYIDRQRGVVKFHFVEQIPADEIPY